MGGPLRDANQGLILHVADVAGNLEPLDAGALTVIQAKPANDALCQPSAPQPNNKLVAVLEKFRLGQFGAPAASDHVQRSGTGFFDVMGQEQRFGDQRIPGQRRMLVAQLFGRQAGRQFAGVPDLHPISKDVDLNRSRRGIISMGHARAFKGIRCVAPTTGSPPTYCRPAWMKR